MLTLQTQAAWILAAAYVLSLAYEIWRATAKAGTSRNDSIPVFFKEGAVIYGVAIVVIALLLIYAVRGKSLSA